MAYYKRFLLSILLLFATSTVSAQVNRIYEAREKWGETYVRALAILSKAETLPPGEASLGNWLLESAFADAGGSCLIAGWSGTSKNGRCVGRSDYMKAREACGGAGHVPCNPEVFGPSLCIPKPSHSRWTQECSRAFLKSQGVDKAIDKLTRDDYATIGKKLIEEKVVNLVDVVYKSGQVCGDIRNIGLDRNDCNRVNTLFRESAKYVGLEVKNEKSNKTEKLTFKPQPGVLSRKEPSKKPLDKKRDEKDCSTIDHSKDTGSVANQGATGSCFAYAAAQVMGFRSRFGYISARATALQYAKFMGQFDKPNPDPESPLLDFAGFSGGTVSNAIRAANSYGVCSELALGSVQGQEFDNYYVKLKKDFENYHKALLAGDTKTCNALEKNLVLDANKLSDLKEVSDYLNRSVASDVKDQANKKTFYDPYVKALKESETLDTFLFEIVNNSCKRVHFEDKKNPYWPEWGKDFTDVGITDNNQQKAVDELHRTLENGDIQAFSYITDGMILTPAKGHGYHASVAVGRRYIDKPEGNRKAGCYFLVKNSWGSGWPQNKVKRDPQYAEYLKNASSIIDPQYPGYFLVHEEDLAKNLISITSYTKN